MPDRRYPLDSLMKATGLTEYALGRKIGLSGTPLKKARELGLVEARADRAAVACGLTPWLVWPEWLEDAEVECEECSARFVPARRDQRYCAPACRWRRSSRERYRHRYRNEPDFRERELERVRAYQSDPKVAQVRRRKQRARDQGAAA